MLKVINQLPSPVIELLTSKNYKPKSGRFGVTALIAPVQQTVLKRRYHNQIKAAEKPTDAQARVLGTIAHEALENAGKDLISRGEKLQLERFITISVFDWLLTGVMDLYADGFVYDYKLTGAKGFGSIDREEEWIIQLSIYAHLLRREGAEVKGARIVMWSKDYSQLTGLREKVYPPDSIVCLELPIWDDATTERYINKKMSLVIANHWAKDKDLTPCTAKQMWKKPDAYAAQKKGLKRASRLLSSNEAAQEWISQQKKPELFTIDFRPGRRNRCEGVIPGGPCYCDAAPYCQQHKEYLALKGNKE